MSFDLNKNNNDSENEKGFSLEKKDGLGGNSLKKDVNLKKSGGDSKVKLDLSKDKNNETTTSQVTSDTADKKGSSKGLVIAAVLAVALGAFWFFNRDTTNVVDGEPDTTIVASPEDSTAVEDGSITTTPIDSVNDVPSETVSGTDNSVTSNPSVSSQGSEGSSAPANSEVASGKPASAGSVADSPVKEGTVEDKARKVIDGVYGNGIDRKNALGDEYRAIQSKVNELYRRGLN
jgi:hypothetical protein